MHSERQPYSKHKKSVHACPAPVFGAATGWDCATDPRSGGPLGLTLGRGGGGGGGGGGTFLGGCGTGRDFGFGGRTGEGGLP